ncbi:MAG: hypothetical protein WCJ35_20570 [Planctomycetota bacterium]
MTRKDLEQLAIDYHDRQATWTTFWRDHSEAVIKLAIHDKEPLARRLCGLVTAGNLDGAEPVPNGWSEPLPYEIAEDARPAPVLVVDDVTTAARCLWQPAEARS